MRVLIRLALTTLAFAPAALAQDDVAALDRTYNSMATVCLDAHNDTAITVVAREKACRDGLASTDAHFASRTAPSIHESNVYRMHRAFLQVEIGGAYLRADGTRSQRVCTQTEAGWDEMSRIIFGYSPAEHEANYRKMRTGIGTAVQACRGDFGTPPGGVPVQ